MGEGERQVETLRCWAAQLVRRRDRRRPGEVSWAEGTTDDQAADAVDAWATEAGTTWLLAHNVGFDLVATRLAEGLAARGWELSSRFGLGNVGMWAVLHKGRRVKRDARRGGPGGQGAERVDWDHSLTIADSFSLLPVGLAQLQAHAGIAKPPLPGDSDPPEAWMARCRADVSILAASMLTVMDWWEEADAGRWAVTGPACGWNTYRHTLDPKAVLITSEPEVLEVEHAACYGGRRDAFVVGDLPRGRYGELDFESAYPMIAATQELPRKVLGRLTPQIARAVLDGQARYGLIAECELVTDRPQWPARVGRRVFYPVGRFRTTLAGPDLAAADAAGVLAEVRGGWFYSMSHHMRPWANWVLDLVHARSGDVPEPVRIAAKGWSRSVIGKTAQRGWRDEPFPGPPAAGWSWEPCFIAGSDARAQIGGLGGVYYLSVADQTGDHEFPAVLAYIEAHVRVRLNAVLRAAPPGSVIQCDTDGVMVSYPRLQAARSRTDPANGLAAGRGDVVGETVAEWSQIAAPLSMREKRVFRDVAVYGPQHVVLDGRARFAGVPSSAWKTGDGRWSARLWPGLSWQVAQGDPRGYVRPVQDYLVTGPYAAGWVTASGAVRPAEVMVDAWGGNRLLAWRQTSWAAQGDRLAPVQAEWARGLWGEADARGAGQD